MIFVWFVRLLLTVAFDWCVVLLELRCVVFFVRRGRVLVVVVALCLQCLRVVHHSLRSLFAAVWFGYVGAQGWRRVKVPA